MTLLVLDTEEVPLPLARDADLTVLQKPVGVEIVTPHNSSAVFQDISADSFDKGFIPLTNLGSKNLRFLITSRQPVVTAESFVKGRAVS